VFFFFVGTRLLFIKSAVIDMIQYMGHSSPVMNDLDRLESANYPQDPKGSKRMQRASHAGNPSPACATVLSVIVTHCKSFSS